MRPHPHRQSERIARYVNELVGGRGRFWADRCFGRELTSPRQVRNALAYVLANFRKHARTAPPLGIDPFPRTHEATRDEEWVVRPAEQWLTQSGWRRHRLVALGETPRAARAAVSPT